jgi:hypothetical protein
MKLGIIKGELASFVERKHKILRPLRIGRKPCAVDREKRISSGEGRALVPVEERVVLGHALPKGRGLLDQIGVVARLGPEEGGLTGLKAMSFLRP